MGAFRELLKQNGHSDQDIDSIIQSKGIVDDPIDVVPPAMKSIAQANIPLILKGLTEQGITDPKAQAYALATTQAESRFKPQDEIPAGPNDPQWLKDDQANYEGGWDYHGRGFNQLTNKSAYSRYGGMLNLPLDTHPELVNDPHVAAKVLALYMNDRGTTEAANKGDYERARKTVNNDDKGKQIAGYAKLFEQAIKGPFGQVQPTPVTISPNQPGLSYGN